MWAEMISVRVNTNFNNIHITHMWRIALVSETKFELSYVIKSMNKMEDHLSGDSKRLSDSTATTERLKTVPQHVFIICTVIVHVNNIPTMQIFTEKYSVNIINMLPMTGCPLDFKNNALSDTH